MKYRTDKVDFPKIIRQARELLDETQERFGERFNRGTPMVSLWESGKRKAPYEVLSFALSVVDKYEICSTCKGKGITRKKYEPTKPIK